MLEYKMSQVLIKILEHAESLAIYGENSLFDSQSRARSWGIKSFSEWNDLTHSDVCQSRSRAT